MNPVFVKDIDDVGMVVVVVALRVASAYDVSKAGLKLAQRIACKMMDGCMPQLQSTWKAGYS